jgi:hypothetical protein
MGIIARLASHTLSWLRPYEEIPGLDLAPPGYQDDAADAVDLDNFFLLESGTRWIRPSALRFAGIGGSAVVAGTRACLRVDDGFGRKA